MKNEDSFATHNTCLALVYMRCMANQTEQPYCEAPNIISYGIILVVKPSKNMILHAGVVSVSY